eukprot:CAMPEP_0203750012 /NCGR_PEP_ID=MMETSP0098-20131031/4329_1 /ASSEMBLY_ACC=CAM_ASM_000208 /TAXON_ID=96639 /ORGANISM=" , Strain NY0313808BC1" /LENGTH=292 /DNA_ID=CAMNT_0050639137 /DNA_START=30 /DNA_END=905 /DNA_ORIENTATION=-
MKAFIVAVSSGLLSSLVSATVYECTCDGVCSFTADPHMINFNGDKSNYVRGGVFYESGGNNFTLGLSDTNYTTQLLNNGTVFADAEEVCKGHNDGYTTNFTGFEFDSTAKVYDQSLFIQVSCHRPMGCDEPNSTVKCYHYFNAAYVKTDKFNSGTKDVDFIDEEANELGSTGQCMPENQLAQGAPKSNWNCTCKPGTIAPTMHIITTPQPTKSPTHSPTDPPTHSPTESPTHSPTHSPTKSPTESPTHSPTHSPTKSPTESPTHSPTHSPTTSPTESPTHSPTHSPTKSPTE